MFVVRKMVMSKLANLLWFSMCLWTMSTMICAGWDNYSDTWTATDALGRSVSTYREAGPPRKDKYVGVFYFLWLGQHSKSGPHDITKILAADPDAMSKPDSPLWGPKAAFHHWGEPLFGYYLSDDRWVLRKHAQMLADAGVDMVAFDVTNQFTYKSCYTALCETWSEVRKDGGKTPQIAFLCPFGSPQKVVRELYNDLYSKNLYQELWFHWKGRPLILADPDLVEPELKEAFTYRKPQPSYFVGPTGPNQWGWLEKYPQHIFYDSDGKPEQMVVGIGQNARHGILSAFSEADTYGRSWHGDKKDERPGAVNYGYNVMEQWERALEVDPELIFITGWNEWVAMRLEQFHGVREPVMFVDQFTQEYSRDIEPMKGGHGDAYYYQMVDYIRKFKGCRKPARVGSPKTISIDGYFSDWNFVLPAYRDDVGDTMHRDHPGWGSEGQYKNNTGRNDFVLLKVARDSNYVYFYARTREPITPHTGKNWMMLFINSDGDARTGWEGYNFVVNRQVPTNSIAVVEKSTGGWNWTRAGEVNYAVRANEIEMAIPRMALGLKQTKKIRLEFKWADNMQKEADIMEFTVNGDSAPNGRFAYGYYE